MVATPRDHGLKAAREAPSREGYEIIVASRAAEPPDAAPPALLRPRPSPLGPDTFAVTDERGERSWSLAGPSGESISVRLRAGPDASRRELSSILDAIHESLLAGGGR
jgi:hypothetical protein